MDLAPRISAKPSVFTRIYFTVGILLFSLMPVIWTVAARLGGGTDEALDFNVVLLVVALQGLLWFAQRRCATDERPYWDSLLVIAACLSTGWIYLDVILVPAALLAAIVASCTLAFTNNPPARMSRLVYWFYDHRMEQ